MKTKLLMVCILAMIIIGTPLQVFASDGVNEGASVEENQMIIQEMSLEEAERWYNELIKEDMIEPRSDLGTCELGISSSDGKLVVIYSTSCRGIASRIGVKNITLQQKKGLLWDDIVVRSAYEENTDAYFGGFYLTNPGVGNTFRVHGVHYAVKDGSELSIYNETDTYKFNG